MSRTRGYEGKILNGEKLAEIANKIYALQYGDDYIDCKVDNLLLIELEEKDVFGDHKYAVVCSEGVGWEQDEYGCIEIPTNIGPMGLWNGHVFISVKIIKQCMTANIEDISDYIRVFGDRLDRNCSLWQCKMSASSRVVGV